jgi:hypothetical protein
MKTILCDICTKNNLCRKKYLKKDKCSFFAASISNPTYVEEKVNEVSDTNNLTLDEQLKLLLILLEHNKTLYFSFREKDLWIKKYSETKEWLDKCRGGASRFERCSNSNCEARYSNIKSMLLNSNGSAGRCIYPGCAQSIDK